MLAVADRDYDPGTGTFTTRDPLGDVAGTTTHTNPYAYSLNDPLNRVDPLGLRSTDSNFQFVSFQQQNGSAATYLVNDLSPDGACRCSAAAFAGVNATQFITGHWQGDAFAEASLVAGPRYGMDPRMIFGLVLTETGSPFSNQRLNHLQQTFRDGSIGPINIHRSTIDRISGDGVMQGLTAGENVGVAPEDGIANAMEYFIANAGVHRSYTTSVAGFLLAEKRTWIRLWASARGVAEIWPFEAASKYRSESGSRFLLMSALLGRGYNQTWSSAAQAFDELDKFSPGMGVGESGCRFGVCSPTALANTSNDPGRIYANRYTQGRCEAGQKLGDVGTLIDGVFGC